MKLLPLLLLLLIVLPVIEPYGLKCSQLMNSEALYELEFLQHPYSYNHTYSLDGSSYLLQYNFCKYITTPCEDTLSYASLFYSQDNRQQCTRLTSDSQLTNYRFQLLNQGHYNQGLSYLLTGGSQYSTHVKYQLEYQILCNPQESSFKLIDLAISENRYILKGESQYGCPIMQISSLFMFVSRFKYLFAIPLLLVSLVVCFNGFNILIPVLFIFGYLSGFLFVLLLFGEFILSQSITQLLLFICILISIIIGSIIGYVFIKLPRIAYTAIGIWLGIVCCFMLNSLLLSSLQIGPKNGLLYVCLAVVCPLSGYLSFHHWQSLAIANTAILGAYGVVRAFSIYIGHFPNELSFQSINNIASQSDQVYSVLYLVFISALSLAGIYVQVVRKRRDQKELDMIEEGLVVELNSYSQL